MATTKTHHNVKALVSVKHSDIGFIKNIVTGIFGNNHLLLELVSEQLHSSNFHFIPFTRAHTQRHVFDICLDDMYSIVKSNVFDSIGLCVLI